MGKGKDRNPRKRRKATDQELKKRRAKKARQNAKKAEENRRKGQDAKARFIRQMAGASEPASDDLSTSSASNEDDGHREQAEAEEDGHVHHTFAADLDEEEETDNTEKGNREKDGVMHYYMASIMSRLQAESSERETNVTDDWLHQFLKQNGWWIRAEQAEFVCRKLGIEFKERLYYRDVRVWFPEEEFGVDAMPTCSTCKRNHRVRCNTYPMHHPGRRVTDIETYYYIMAKQYLCTDCQKEHNDRKRRANGGPFEAVKHTCMGSDEEVRRCLPYWYQYEFPAFLTYKAALDLKVVDLMRPMFDAGLRPETLSNMLLEMHSKRYYNDYLKFELRLERKADSAASHFQAEDNEAEMFSPFKDRTKYNGRVPTASYLETVYKENHESLRAHFDRDVKKVPITRLHLDGNAKVPKKLSRYHGKSVFNTLQTGTNEHGHIRVQSLTPTDSHESLKPSLDAMQATQKDLGQSEIELVFTDKPAADRNFVLENFDKVKATQERLDRIAEERNARLGLGPENASATAPAAPPNETPPGLKDASGYDPSCVEILTTVTEINDKIDAMREEVEEQGGPLTFALDAEWDVIRRGRGRWKKDGKVRLVQIGYWRNGKVHVFLIRLNSSWEKLPDRLLALLKDDRATFVGVLVKNDINLLGVDYGDSRNSGPLSDHVNYLELGMHARKRDVVQQGNVGLAALVETVLGEHLDKCDDVRCSKWSTPVLTERQQKYASLDVIKPLEIHRKLASLPDLSQRLNPASTYDGMLVDIVPPHARNNVLKPARNFRAGDLATRAALGRILPDKRVKSVPGIWPNLVKVNDDCRIVEVTKVLAPSLRIPNYKLGSSRGKGACLGDFGSAPFKLVLPLTMLKPHVETHEVRVYNDVPVTPSRRRITPPARGTAASTDINVETVEDDEDDEDETCFVDEELRDILHGGESTDGDPEPLDADDADTEQRHVDLIREAEIEAELAEKEGNVQRMRCKDLDEPPDVIRDRFSAVLGDCFHAMKRPWIPTRHEYRKPYLVALMRAFFAWDETKSSEVYEKLRKGGWTDHDIDTTMYYRPAFFRQRIERIVLPPRQLYWRVRAVFVKFGYKRDSKSGKPLFNAGAWRRANNVLKEILEGLYSDPPGFNFYYFLLDEDGNIKEDKYGIKLIGCSRGTNDVEGIHKHYWTTFRHVTGIEMGDCLLAERRHRHNERTSQAQFPGYPKLGHFDTWKMDKLQLLVEKNHGITLEPGWVNGSDHRTTDESFVTVAIHSEELHEAVKAVEISEAALKKLTSDQKFLARSMGIPVPFLPVHSIKEKRLFTTLLLETHGGFDDSAMALEVMKHVDGIEVFPKTPAHLREYHKSWERNRRVRDAVRGMKTDIQVLEKINEEQLPDELRQCNDDGDGGLIPMDDDGVDTSSATVGGNGPQLCRPIAAPPVQAAMLRPRMQALRPLGEPAPVVGLEIIGESISLPTAQARKRRNGQRGGDTKKRRERRCRRCMASHASDEVARSCPGRGGGKFCENFDEDGRPKST